MTLRIQLEQFSPLEAMQILPAAIQYKQRLEKSGSHVRITSSNNYIHQFLAPYQPEMIASPYLKQELPETMVNFPLETSMPTGPLKWLASNFYQANSSEFFNSTDFPNNSRGKFQKALYHQTHNGSYIYYVPRFADCEPDVIDRDFWETFLFKCRQLNIPLMTHVNWISVGLGKSATESSLVEFNQLNGFTWEIATALLLSRFYLGGYNIISELAMLLDVPCVILLTEETRKFPLERKPNVQYVTSTHSRFEYEDFISASKCLERMFLSEL